MRTHAKTFLDLRPPWCEPERAAVRIVPVPYEGGISYGGGAARGPDAVIEASAQLELYDEVLDVEPYRAGIATLAPPVLPGQPAGVAETLYHFFRDLVQDDALLIALGGDHSITPPLVRALMEKHQTLSVVQVDAHADLRPQYNGSPFSHACVMHRVRACTPHTLQVGIRSLSVEEAQRIKAEQIDLCTMHAYRDAGFPVDAALDALPDPLFLTLDVDVLDWSVVAATGTPEPGGFLWDEIIALLDRIFRVRTVIGFDVVELAPEPGERNSAFAVAKLIYKMIGLHARGRAHSP